MNYTVFRSDLMSGTKQPADLVSLRYYVGEDQAEVENGVIVELGAYEEGAREVRKATAATAESDLDNCAIVAGVEVMYDERKRNLDEFINEKGKATRGYLLRTNNIFSVTAEGFVGKSVPSVGATVGIGANGKINASGTGLGKCIAIENAGRYTYYVIEIKKA